MQNLTQEKMQLQKGPESARSDRMQPNEVSFIQSRSNDFERVRQLLIESKSLLKEAIPQIQNSQIKQLFRSYLRKGSFMLESQAYFIQIIHSQVETLLVDYRQQIHCYFDRVTDRELAQKQYLIFVDKLLSDENNSMIILNIQPIESTQNQQQLGYFQEINHIQDERLRSSQNTSLKQKIKVFLLIVSGLKFKNDFKIRKKQQNQNHHEDVLAYTSPVLKFNKQYIAYAQFESQTQSNSLYTIHFKEAWTINSRWEHQLQQVAVMEKVKNTAISFLSTKSTQETDDQAKKFAILSSIKYFIKANCHINQSSGFSSLDQEAIFPLLWLLRREFLRVLNQPNYQAIYDQLQPCQPYKAHFNLEAKYFLYFFKSIYQQHADTKYQQYKLYKIVAFGQLFPSRLILNYSRRKVSELYQFYLKVGYFHCLKYVTDTSETRMQVLVHFLRTNLKLQNQQQALAILRQAVNFSNQYPHLYQCDEHITEFLRDSKKVSATEYFNIRTKYLKAWLKSLKNNPPPQFHSYTALKQRIQSQILGFLDDLIYKCKDFGNQQPQIVHNQEVLEIFLSLDVWNVNQLLFKPSKYLLMMAKIKQLIRASNHAFDFKTILQQFIKITEQSISKYCIIQVIQALLLEPCSQFDKQQLKKLFKVAPACNLPLKALFARLLQTAQNIDISHFLQICRTYLSTPTNNIIIEQQNLLVELSGLAQLQQSSSKQQLLASIFEAVLQNVKFTNLNYRVYKKRYVEMSRSIKVRKLKFKLLSHIFCQVKSIRNKTNYQFFDTLYQLYLVHRDSQQQKLLIDSYIELQASLSDQQLVEIIWCSLQFDLEFLSLFLFQKNYVECQRIVISQLNKDDCNCRQLERMFMLMKENNTQIRDILLHLNVPINVAIIDCNNRYNNFKTKVLKTIKIFESPRIGLQKQKKELKLHLKGVESIKLAQLYKLSPSLSKICQQCEGISAINQYAFWRKEKVTDSNSLYKQYLYVRNLVKLQLSKLQDRTLSLIQFEHYFGQSNAEQLAYCCSGNQQQLLKTYKQKCKVTYIQQLELICDHKVSESEAINARLVQNLTKLRIYLQKIDSFDRQLKVWELMSCVSQIEQALYT